MNEHKLVNTLAHQVNDNSNCKVRTVQHNDYRVQGAGEKIHSLGI